MRYCLDCGRDREGKKERCKCGCPSYSITPTIGYRNYLRRTGKIVTSRVIICGPEELRRPVLIKNRLDKVTRKLQDLYIYLGGFKGFYKFVSDWCTEKRYVYEPYYPRGYHQGSAKKGRDMLLERNQELVEKGAKFLIAFSDGEDSSIMNMISLARKKGIITKIIDVE